MDDRKIKCSDAARILERPHGVQEQAVELVLAGQVRTVKAAADEVERETAEAEGEEIRHAVLAMALSDTVTLHTASLSALLPLAPAASIDAIVTNPPETQEFLPRFSDLASFADHVLKSGGVLVIGGSGIFLPRIIKNLEHEHLVWMAELDLLFRGRPAGSGTPRFMQLHRRPVLVYSKGSFPMNGMDDLLEVPPPEEVPQGLNERETAMDLPAELRELGPSYRSTTPEGTRQWLEIERASQPGGAAPPQPLRQPITYARLRSMAVSTLVRQEKPTCSLLRR